MELELSRQIFEKYSNIKLLESPCSGSRVVPCGRTDITRLIVLFSVLRTRLVTNHIMVSEVLPQETELPE